LKRLTVDRLTAAGVCVHAERVRRPKAFKIVTNANTSLIRDARSTLWAFLGILVASGGGAAVAASPHPTEVAAIVAGSAIGAVAITAPVTTMYLAVLAIPLEFTSVSVGVATISPPEALLALSAVGWLIQSAIQGRSPIPRSRMTWTLVLLSASVLPGVVVAENTALVVKASVLWIAWLLLYGLIVSVGSLTMIRHIMAMMTIAGGVTGAIAIYASRGKLPTIDTLGDVAANRATGPFSQANTLAMFLAMAMICAVVMSQTQRGIRRWATIIPIALCAGGLVLSLSRGGFVALAVAALPLLAWRPLRHTIVRIGALAIILAVVGSATLARVPIISLVSTRLSSISGAAHGQNPRWEVWTTTLRMIRDHIATGIGTYQFPYASVRYGLFQPHYQPYGHAHNFVLTIVVERGWLGLLALVFMAVLLPRVLVSAMASNLGRDRIYGIGVVAVLVTFFVKGLVDYDTGNNLVAALFFIFCGCATVAATAAREAHASGWELAVSAQRPGASTAAGPI
jgi:O-antigen ligase